MGPEEIATVVSRWTGIPVVRLQQTEREKLLHLVGGNKLFFSRQECNLLGFGFLAAAEGKHVQTF